MANQAQYNDEPDQQPLPKSDTLPEKDMSGEADMEPSSPPAVDTNLDAGKGNDVSPDNPLVSLGAGTKYKGWY